jgi:hypothetical protein
MSEAKENIEDYIKKEISKSGFPLEISIATILAKHGWLVIPHLIYPVGDNGFQELDIHATKNTKIEGLQNILVVECKKQESKPWVFFEQDSLNKNVFTLNMSPINIYYAKIETSFFPRHHYYGKKPCAYHFPCFVKRRGETESGDVQGQGGGDVILKAINQVLDSLIFSWEMETERYVKLKNKIVSVLYPIIVFQGKLFSAQVLPDGEIRTNEAKFLQLRVSRALKELTTFRYSETNSLVVSVKDFIIDVVHQDYFEEYLKNLI